MTASPSRFDDLPTLALPALKRVPPPLPPRRTLEAVGFVRGEQSSARLTPLRLPVVIPRALFRAKLLIELPLDELEPREIAQITTWLRGRGSSVVVRRNLVVRAAGAVLQRAVALGRTARTLGRAVRARVVEAVAGTFLSRRNDVTEASRRSTIPFDVPDLELAPRR
jgi:hypothetical protein